MVMLFPLPLMAVLLPLEITNALVPAYLDAGTGSLIFQMAIAGVVSFSVVFGGVIAQLRSFFARLLGKSLASATMETDELSNRPESTGAIKTTDGADSQEHRKVA